MTKNGLCEKKKTDKKIQKKEKKSRAEYKCPDGLADSIELLRDVSPNISLPDKDALFEEYKLPPRPDLPKEEGQYLLFERNKKVLQECLKDFAENYAKKLFTRYGANQMSRNPNQEPIISQNFALFDALEWYDDFREQRDYLHSIARFFAQLRAGNNLYEGEREVITSSGERLELPVISVPLTREGVKGKIWLETVENLIGLDLDRIRECEICNHIFWANNKNSFTCSEPCRNALRQRTFRREHKEAVNTKRRERYQRKKQEKELAREERRKALLDKYKKE